VVRLRQVVLVARDLEPVVASLRSELELGEPFRDREVEAFGLQNAVMALGDTFVEVVSPVEPGTAAGRYRDRRGRDGGYMVMFELDDIAGARRRAADAHIREVFATELPDVVDVHLHPRDIGGAIVALDRPEPAGSWRWGGPAWQGMVPAHDPGGVTGVTLQVADPAAVAARWAHVLGLRADGDTIQLEGGTLRFTGPPDGRGDGIVAFDVALAGRDETVDIAGARFHLHPTLSATRISTADVLSPQSSRRPA
jgi:hypothetical protein